jgi:hypothetical protein
MFLERSCKEFYEVKNTQGVIEMKSSRSIRLVATTALLMPVLAFAETPSNVPDHRGVPAAASSTNVALVHRNGVAAQSVTIAESEKTSKASKAADTAKAPSSDYDYTNDYENGGFFGDGKQEN